MIETTKENALKRAIEECVKIYEKRNYISAFDYDKISFRFGVNKAELVAEFNIYMIKRKQQNVD